MSHIGRPLEFDPEEALESAMLLFWQHGYEATSLHDLITEMGLSKSSFYQTFKSKQSLFKNCILHYKELLLGQLKQQLKDASSGRSFIEILFKMIASEADSSDIPKGCLLMNTANEFSQTDPEISKMVRASIESLTNIFEQAIQQSQKKGEITTEISPINLAIYLVTSISGLRNMIKAGESRKELNEVVKLTLSVLD